MVTRTEEVDVSVVAKEWNKVFEVGIQRTGTSSLGVAFRQLGLRTKGWDETLYWECIRGGYDKTIETAAHFDAFEDLPWDFDGMYRVLDTAFPGSRFVVLERPTDDWVQSYCRAFPDQDPQFLRSWKERKYEDIFDYFADRPKDLLVMNLVGGEGWETLCPFLGLDEPNERFPHQNEGSAEGFQAKRKRFRLGR